MGTRHFIGVVLDGDFKVAQYGQWDGYPTGQGATVLKFLRLMDRPKFEANLRASHFMTQAELDEFDRIADVNPITWPTTYPHMSRDAGAEILSMVQARPLALVDRRDFTRDSLFCEWAYIIDLDTNQLEVYKGFNHEPLPPGQRFSSLEPLPNHAGVVEYYPIRLVKTYAFDALPTVEQLDAECYPSEDEE